MRLEVGEELGERDGEVDSSSGRDRRHVVPVDAKESDDEDTGDGEEDNKLHQPLG